MSGNQPYKGVNNFTNCGGLPSARRPTSRLEVLDGRPPTPLPPSECSEAGFFYFLIPARPSYGP